jgi:CheY-like chemotaxis protein
VAVIEHAHQRHATRFAIDLAAARAELDAAPTDFLFVEGALATHDEASWRAVRQAYRGTIVALHALGLPPDLDGAQATLTAPVREASLRAILNELPAAGSRPAPAVRQVESLASLPPLRVLLVDDNAINRTVASQMLQKLGLDPATAADGDEAIEAVLGGDFDIVLMDVQMPEIDGLEATRRIRRSLAGRQPRIVAMTANAIEGDREACLDAGMDDYLAKPVRLETLAATLRRQVSFLP